MTPRLRRIAVYRVLSALCARQWMAVEVVNNSALLERLTDARSESAAPVCQWRFVSIQVDPDRVFLSQRLLPHRVAGQPSIEPPHGDVLQALDSATSRAAHENGLANGAAALSDRLRAAAPVVAAAVRAGPYGGGGRGAAAVAEPATRA